MKPMPIGWTARLTGVAMSATALLTACGGSTEPDAPTTAAKDQEVRSFAISSVGLTLSNHLVRSAAGPDTVEVYSDDKRTGSMERFGPGVFTSAKGLADVDAFRTLGNDAASSLQVGAAATVWLCDGFAAPAADKHRDLGACQVFTGGQGNSLIPLGFNDKTSSVIVTAGKSSRPAKGIVAWSGDNFVGATQSFQVGGFDYADIVNGVGNDAISSIEVKPGYLAVLCTNGVSHAQTPLANGQPTGAACKLFPAGKYPTMPAGFADIVTYLNVLPVATNPAAVGAFSPVNNWPYAAIHQYLLPDGRVMANESIADDGEPTTPEYMIWDPATNAVTTGTMFAKGADLFCSAHVHLPSGDLLAVSTGGGGNPVNTVLRYDTATGRWETAPSMVWKRYYPSASLTPKGSVLVTGGNDVFGKAYSTGTIAINTPEIFEKWAWRDLPDAKIPFSANRGPTNDSAYWPWVQAAPNGRMFMAGPDLGMRYIDTEGKGALSEQGNRDTTFRSYGSYATFSPGKMLVAGGSSSVATASVIAFDGKAAQVTPVANMNYGRRQLTLTILSNGEVFASGGNSDGQETYSAANPVLTTELWNPSTQTWRVAADHVKSRQYHSTAMLIPDGRVVVAGQCGGPPCERNAEIYSPPYLFEADGSPAARPVINKVADQWRYGTRIGIGYAGSSVTKAHLIKLGAVTHSTNFEQRLVPLAIASNNGAQMQVDTPADANAAPPGHYMLVLVDAKGVPSVAKIVQVTANVAPLGTASQSTSWGGGSLFPAGNAIDGSLSSFSHTATEDTASTWTLQWTRDYKIEQIALHNRGGSEAQRMRDIKVTVYDAAGKAVYTSPLLNPGNAMKSPKRLELDFYRLGVGAVTGRKIVVQRQPDKSLAGGPGDNADGVGSLTLTEVQVFAAD